MADLQGKENGGGDIDGFFLWVPLLKTLQMGTKSDQISLNRIPFQI
jgi:hypothetical protein